MSPQSSTTDAGTLPGTRTAPLETPAPAAPQRAERLAHVLERIFHRLDRISGHGPPQRLWVVCEELALATGALGWWVAGVRERRLVTISRVWLDRPGAATTVGEPDDLVSPEDGQALPAELVPFTESPRLARALEGGSFSLVQDSDDPVAPRLAGIGLHGAAGAGGYDADCRQWSAVLMLGPDSEPAGTVQLALTAGTQAALGYPRPPRGA